MNIGQLVKLKSGGCPMTVSSVPTNKHESEYMRTAVVVRCVWHDNDGKPQSSVYPVDLLDQVHRVS